LCPTTINWHNQFTSHRKREPLESMPQHARMAVSAKNNTQPSYAPTDIQVVMYTISMAPHDD